MKEHTIELKVTLHIGWDGNLHYIRDTDVSESCCCYMGRKHKNLCSVVRKAINNELENNDLPDEDNQ